MTRRSHRGGAHRPVSPRRAPRHRLTAARSLRTPVVSGLPTPARPQACTDVRAEELWERHGRSAYAIACVLLGDAAAAARAVELGMADLAQSTAQSTAQSSGQESARETRRVMARHIYRRCQELAGDTSRTLRMPATMVWLSQLAQLQRACLALCLFGGHTHGEAAALLGVAPPTAASLLTSGLKELGRLAAAEPAPG